MKKKSLSLSLVENNTNILLFMYGPNKSALQVEKPRKEICIIKNRVIYYGKSIKNKDTTAHTK